MNNKGDNFQSTSASTIMNYLFKHMGMLWQLDAFEDSDDDHCKEYTEEVEGYWLSAEAEEKRSDAEG